MVEELVKGRYHARLGSNLEALFTLEEGAWTQEPIQHGGERYLALVRKKYPGRIPPLSEVEDRVARDYTARKQQEAMEAAFKDLALRYDVKIMEPPGKEPPSQREEEDG
jgi:hypothetical protein